MQDLGGQGVGEVVKGEGEEAEDFLPVGGGVGTVGVAQQDAGLRRVGGVDALADVREVIAFLARRAPRFDVGVQVRQDELDAAGRAGLAAVMVALPGGGAVLRWRVGFGKQSCVEDAFDLGRRPACPGAEVDEGQFLNGVFAAEDGVQGRCDELGGGAALDDGKVEGPGYGEAGLNGGPEA